MVVDSDTCNFKDFVDEIVTKYLPGYDELVAVAYYDSITVKHIEIKSDQDLLAMFAKHAECKVVNIAIAYPLPTENLEWPNMSKEHVKIHSTDPTSSQLTEPTSSEPTEPTTTYPDDDEYLANPEPENEFVGVDDEGLYLQIAPQTGFSLDGDASESKSDLDSDEDYEEEDGLLE
jgi:hypothetical protein